jgi:hypothetical protein
MKRHAVTFLVELSLLVTFVIPGVAQSTTKARMITIPLLQYPAEALQRHIQGRGVIMPFVFGISSALFDKSLKVLKIMIAVSQARNHFI